MYLQGLPEAEASGEVFKYSCQARSRLEGSLELRLEGLGRLSGTETFSHDLVIPASKQSALKNALQLVPQFDSIADPSQPLRYLRAVLGHTFPHDCARYCKRLWFCQAQSYLDSFVLKTVKLTQGACPLCFGCQICLDN